MEGKIDKRNGGCGVIFENKLYVWGGESVDKYNLLAELSSEEEEEEGEGREEKEEEEDPVVEIVPDQMTQTTHLMFSTWIHTYGAVGPRTGTPLPSVLDQH